MDSRSASAEEVNLHLKGFVKSRATVLFVVDSGFKNQQLGADKNQWGTARIITRDRKLTYKFYKNIKQREPALLSATSHRHRRYMKEIGVVPTTKNFIRPKCECLVNDLLTSVRFRVKSTYGMDVWMKYTLPTLHVLYFGIQAKKGKLDSAGASKGGSSNVAEILNQVTMMLRHQIFDPEVNRHVLIDHALIVAGVEITK